MSNNRILGYNTGQLQTANPWAEQQAKFGALQLGADPQQAPKKKGNFLTHLLPTGGGIGGGAAGAAIGTALLPGIGTLAGALLGGAIGGGGAKVAENKLEGQGAFNGVTGAALENGILSAGPLRLAKAVGGVSKGIKAGEGLIGALNRGGEAATRPSALRTAIANKGAQMEARAGGFGIGEKVSGSQPLGYYDSAAITKTLKTEGIKAGSPENRLKAVEDALGARGKQIDTHLTTNNAALSQAQKQAVAKNFLAEIENQPGVDDLVRKKAQTLADNFVKQTSDAKSLVQFRRGLDNQVINFNQNPSSALAAKQLAARTFRDVLSKRTEELAPGITKANRSYADLSRAKEYLIGANKAVSDQSQGGGGIVSRILTNDTAQAAKSRGGAALQKIAPKEGANPFGVKAITGRTAPLGLAQALGASAQPVMNNSSNQIPNAISSIDNITNPQYADSNADAIDSSPFDVNNIEANIEQILANGGKTSDVKDYVSLVSTIQSLKAAQDKSAGKSLNSTQLQQANNAQSGLDSLNTIAQILQSDPSAAKKASIPGGSLATALTGTGQYKAALNNATDVIGRLRSGGAINADEEKRFRSLLPQSFDDQQTVAYKLNALADLFDRFVNPQSAAGLDSADLQAALGQ